MSNQKPGQKPSPTPPKPQADPSIISIVKKGGDKPDITRPAPSPDITRK